MSYDKYLQNLARLVELIKRENTGNAQEIADKLEISRRSVFRYLDLLKDFGADIEFSKELNSYILRNNFCIFEDFFKRVL